MDSIYRLYTTGGPALSTKPSTQTPRQRKGSNGPDEQLAPHHKAWQASWPSVLHCACGLLALPPVSRSAVVTGAEPSRCGVTKVCKRRGGARSDSTLSSRSCHGQQGEDAKGRQHSRGECTPHISHFFCSLTRKEAVGEQLWTSCPV